MYIDVQSEHWDGRSAWRAYLMRATRVSFVYILLPSPSARSMFKNSAHGSSILRLNDDKTLVATDRLADGSNAVMTFLTNSLFALSSKLPIAVLILMSTFSTGTDMIKDISNAVNQSITAAHNTYSTVYLVCK
jgi:hypothetical protein